MANMNYEDLCSKISNNIFKIGNNVTSMQKLVNQLGTPNETPNVKIQLDKKRVDVKKSVEVTSDLLRQASDQCRTGSPQEEKARKINLDRLKHQFADTLTKYKKYQAIEADKERAQVERMRTRTASLKQEMSGQSGIDTNYADNDSLMDDDTRQQNLAQLQEFADDLETTTALINEREEAIRKLEADMLKVNDIFKEIGTMVYEQGDMIDNIEANVDTARTDVEQGETEIRQAARYQDSYRKKVLIFLVIVVVMAIILGIVIWLFTRNKK